MADRFPLIVDSSAQQLQELAVGDNLNLASSGLINADNIQTSGLSVGVMTATSFIGDGSQLTNLPAAGSSTELTASGTLSDGSKVIVNADGTVSVVAQTETTGPGDGEATVYESAGTYFASATYDSTNQKVVLAYRGTSNYGTAIVGTVSGNSITFGTPVVFESANAIYNSIVYDSANQKVVIAYADNGNSGYGTAIVGTVSGTSISFGSPVVYTSSDANYVTATYDSTNQKVVIAYQDVGNSNYGTAVVGTVSGTSISFGTPVVFNTAYSVFEQATFDSTNGKVVIAYQDGGNNYYGAAIVGTVSGTSISFGASTVFESDTCVPETIVYDPSNQKVVIAYVDNGNSNYATAVVGTVSGTSISFGTPVAITSSRFDYIVATYDSTNQKIVFAYEDFGNSNYGTAIVGTVSGTSISFGTPNVYEYAEVSYQAAVYDPDTQKVVIAYNDNRNSYYGTAVVLSTTGASIPQIGSPEVFESAQADQISATFDSTNNKVVIAYQDAGNSFYGTVVVGTVSGTSISFGTPVIFESATTTSISAVYDSSNQKVVIAYRDTGNSSYGTAIVGTVSGTSISFGSPSVFESATTVDIVATFDSTNNKVVIAYRDRGNSDYGTAVVGTVSGTSISFGSPAVFESAQVFHTSVVYDSSNQKVVIAYSDSGNSNYGTAVVGTVSGTSITFGSPSVFESANTGRKSATFDSSNSRVVIAYQDNGNSGYGTAVVGTVSGTSISFGSPVVFESASSTYFSAVYDSANDKSVIVYRDAGNSNYGTAIAGTVSGTSISFGSSSVFESASSLFISAAYDSTNGKVVIAYQDYANSYYGTAVVFSPLIMSTNLTAENFIGISDGAYTNGQTATIQLIGSVDDAQSSLTPGQKYYVQGDGTLSTTADSPSVLAGTAIASTKLLIKK